jgi:hypothetical protein
VIIHPVVNGAVHPLGGLPMHPRRNPPHSLEHFPAAAVPIFASIRIHSRLSEAQGLVRLSCSVPFRCDRDCAGIDRAHRVITHPVVNGAIHPLGGLPMHPRRNPPHCLEQLPAAAGPVFASIRIHSRLSFFRNIPTKTLRKHFLKYQ